MPAARALSRPKRKTTNQNAKGKNMNNQFDELTKSLAHSVTRRAALKKFRLCLAGMALACYGLAQAVQAQMSIVCDPAGDIVLTFGKSSQTVPAWLDITQAEITGDSRGNLLF